MASGFTGNLNLIKYKATPRSGHEVLTIVGYPADKKLDDDAGAEMYEGSNDVEYDLNKSFKNMLSYRISTYGGKFPLSAPHEAWHLTSNRFKATPDLRF